MGSIAAPAGPGRWLLFALTLLATLWFGLDPKDYRFRNEVEWLQEKPGLRFGVFGRVETAPFLTTEAAEALNRDGFSFEFACAPVLESDGFRVLAVAHAGVDRTQLIVGQWHQHLIAMNGDDFDYTRRLPRVTALLSPQAEGPQLLAVTTGVNGTSVYLNGELVAAEPGIRLTLPASPEPGRLVVGNSVRTTQPWIGELSGLAAFSRQLSPLEVRAHFDRWKETRTFRAIQPDTPILLYLFDGQSGYEVKDHGTFGVPLGIPDRPVALGRRILLAEGGSRSGDRSWLLDAALNLIGFMPFGASLAACWAGGRRPARNVLLLAAAAGLLLSLAIELAQAWMPSRDSSLRDLLLNTAGTPLGAWLLLWTTRRGLLTTASAHSSP